MDWFASSCELIAKWLVGNKNKWNFALQLLSCFAWAFVAINSEVYGLFLVIIPASVMNVVNFIKWTKHPPTAGECPHCGGKL